MNHRSLLVADAAASSSAMPRRTPLRRFALQFLPGAVLIITIAALDAVLDARSNERNLREREQVQAAIGASAPVGRLRRALDDARLLARHEAMQTVVASNDPAAWTRLERQFVNLANITQRYDQIRWIGQDGHERLRVDLTADGARLLPSAELQDKSGRYYFSAAVTLPADAFYISPLDLNVERGAVERPFKPMVRVASPVVDADGRRHGIVVLNYLAQEMIDRILAVLGDSSARVSILNEGGYWIHSPEPALSWGFMFDPALTLARRQPQVWQTVAAAAQGQALLDDGLWTWSRVAFDLGSVRAEDHLIQLSLNIVLHSDRERLAAVRWSRAPALAITAALILLIYAALSARLARVSLAREDSEARAARLQAEAAAERVLRSSEAQRLAIEIKLGQEQARSREAAERSSREWRQLAEAMPQLVWASDAEGGYDYVSRQWADYTGVAESALLGSGWLAQIHPADHAAATEAWNRAVASRQALDVELRIRRRDGVFRWFQSRATPIVDRDGHVLRWYGANTDIDDIKNAAKALGVSELRFRTIYDTTPVSIWEQDWSAVIAGIAALRADGVTDIAGYCHAHPQWVDDMLRSVQVLDVNQRTVEMFQAGDKAALLSALRRIFATEDTRTGFIAQLCALAGGRTMFNSEMALNTVPGKRIQVLIAMAFPAADSNAGQVFMTALDITEQHRIAQELELHRHHLEDLVEQGTRELRQANAALADARDRALESERRFRSAFQSAASGMALVSREGHFVEVNTALCALTGYDEAELLKLTFQDITHPDDLDADLALVAELLSHQRSSYHLEKRYYRKDGGVVWILLSASTVDGPDGEVRYFIAQIQDITARKNAEGALREREKFLRTITDALPSMVGYWDAQLRCQFANAAYRSWFGREPHDMIGMHIADLLGTELYADIEPYVRAALAGEPQRFERMLVKADGSRSHVWAQYIPDRDDDTTHGFFVLIADVTDLKHAQIALQEANAALSERTQQAEAASHAKSRFLASMSHEIRTPMNAVLGLAQLLDETPLDARQQDYVRKIRRSSKALLSVLNDILDYSKIEAGRMQLEAVEFSLNDVLDGVSDLFVVAAEEKGLELFLRVAPDVPDALVGDPLRLGQILTNLVGNAIKFTEHGEVRVRVECADCGPSEVKLQFSVEDTGIGLSPEQQTQLFEAFAQADASTTRRYGGSGLGLIISKGLVEQMQGHIDVDSQLGQGSRFHFTVTLGRGRMHTEPPPPAHLRGSRALIVDDHATAQTILTEILHSWQADAVPVPSAAAALDTLQAAAAEDRPFALVLINHTLPDAEGAALAHQISARVRSSSLPPLRCVLMSTDSAGAGRVRRSGGASAATVLAKPVTASRLLEHLTLSETAAARSAKTRQRRKARLRERAAAIAGARVLVAEDNPLNQQVARELLEHLGVAVDVAGDGRVAVERALKQRYDLILMDVQMPELDGLEAARQIRAHAHDDPVPIIAMTAAATAEDREATRAAGMNAHLAKPIDAEQLLAALLRWITPMKNPDTRPSAVTAAPAAAPAAAPSAALPAIAGFAFERVLARLDGRRGLLLRLLRSFAEQCRDEAQSMPAALAAGDRATLARQLHTLKGSAAGVGATAIQALASALESDVAAGQPVTLTPLTEQLRDAATAIDQALDAAEPLPQASADATLLRPQLVALADLIGRHRSVPQPTLDALRRQGGASQRGEIHALIRTVERFDYAGARQQIEQLLEQLP